LVEVLVISVLAGLLGWERESSGKAAGLRTHILVGIASTLFIVIGESMAISFRALGDHIRFDAANLIGAIVTGISFLGAGMIIFKKADNDVKGLTTAAGILTTASIGMLVGLERFFLAVGTTVIVFIVLRFVTTFETKAESPHLTREAGKHDNGD
jgi:putative Mg2+ transporter-C (MgtC) family protein